MSNWRDAVDYLGLPTDSWRLAVGYNGAPGLYALHYRDFPGLGYQYLELPTNSSLPLTAGMLFPMGYPADWYLNPIWVPDH